MLKQLKLDLKLYKNDLWSALVIITVAFLVGFGVVAAVMLLSADPESWITMGTIGALLGMIVWFVVHFVKYSQQFMLALSMGRTRKSFLASYAVRSLLSLALGYGMVLVLYRVELAVGTKLFAPWPLEIDPTFLMDWRIITAVLFGTVILSMFIGTLYSYFGKKALAPMWFAWMAVCLGGPRFAHEEYQWVWNLLPDAAWIGLGIGVIVAMVTTILILGKKQMVK